MLAFRAPRALRVTRLKLKRKGKEMNVDSFILMFHESLGQMLHMGSSNLALAMLNAGML